MPHRRLRCSSTGGEQTTFDLPQHVLHQYPTATRMSAISGWLVNLLHNTEGGATFTTCKFSAYFLLNNSSALMNSPPGCESFRRDGEWTFVSDGGWNHNPRNGEVQLALTLDHLDRECTFTVFVVHAAQMSLWNEAERPNA